MALGAPSATAMLGPRAHSFRIRLGRILGCGGGGCSIVSKTEVCSLTVRLSQSIIQGCGPGS